MAQSLLGIALRIAILGIAAIGSANDAFATETDNFTFRPTDPKDLADHSVLDAWNLKTNQLLNEAMTGLKGCDLKALHSAIKDKLGGGEIGKFEFWATKTPDLKKTTVLQSQSIYADAGLLTGSFGIAAVGIVPSYVVAGKYIGADKLGHFFDQGYDYYEAIYIKHQQAASTIETTGIQDEAGVNGMVGNGVRSYADMAANFSGYLFWRDVMGGTNPYFECKDGKLERTARKFDWADYVSDAWDEGINCSEFSSSVDTGVKKALAKLGLSCPINPKACQNIASQLCGYSFLSPACAPHVKPRTTPDTACLKLIDIDQSQSQACLYKPDTDRLPVIKTIVELKNGLKVKEDDFTVAKREQLFSWASHKKEQAYRQVQRLWKYVHK